MITLTIEQIEEAINLPVEKWKGKCYTIVCQMLKEGIISGRAIYGHWLGSASKTSFFSERRDLPFIHHGWIETPDKRIIDPTRWVFEDVAPYLFISHKNDLVEELYDEGGNKLRESMMSPCPKYSESDKKINKNDISKFDKEVYDYLNELFNNPEYWTIKHIFWLANLAPKFLGVYIREVYYWLENIDCGAFIPLDNKKKYLETN